MAKKILLTGATSGFGKMIAKELLDNGHHLLIAIRGGEKRRTELPLPNHQNLFVVDLDLSRPEDFFHVSEFIQQNWLGQLDVLINNAGFGQLGPIEMQSIEQMERQMQVNLLGPLELTQVCLPFLRSSKGRILNITSMAAFTVFPFYGLYSASKAAFHAASEALYYELRPMGISVAAIEPGGHKTGFDSRIELGDRLLDDQKIYQERINRFKSFLKLVQDKMSQDPKAVVKLLVRLCEQKTIRPRYVVGSDAWINLAFRRFIPDRIFVPIQHWIYQKFFF
ncbi:MAG: SDR family NAD(P)-dependent oxidoreductase [Bdellovibrionales bacterium]|nr:SDR family NAD(P)-dependent oxidoreductase [Bdellovibrionales bacterium]